jgi:hypothetical protein
MKVTFKHAILMASAISLWACSSDNEAPDCNTSNLSLSITGTSNPGCNQTNGSISVVGAGGAGNFTYSIDGVSFVSQGTFQNLSAGTYTLWVMDGNDCMAFVETSLSNETDLNINTTLTEAGCGTTNGAISVTASGGEAPYLFRLNQNEFQHSNEFTNLASGSYTITVQDQNGCETNTNLEIHSGLSLALDIKPIIETNCAISGCHIGSGLPDFRNSATIIANASNIASKTNDKTMPPPGSGGSLTDAEIQKITCWVQDGALNN